NGGDTWSKVYTGEKFTKFTFKDANTGWAVLENKIYKTTDGGVSWILDYTHDQSIRTIAYKNNVVWAISTDKIIKRYL
uniref:WD40/YVTN/BNR-like repeat-containing protein n=1 Tax=Flavobacterium sp. TaxID=239 RepID=UPI00374DD996